MAWIDFKKAFDMVPNSWLIKCLELFGVADNIRALINSSISTWKTELAAEEKVLGEVNIKRGIFQGGCVSPLLFIVVLISLTLVLRKMKAG